MIVCVCKQVSEREVDALLASGCRTVAEVARRTGAGTDCGCCAAALREAVCGRTRGACARSRPAMDQAVAAK